MSSLLNNCRYYVIWYGITQDIMEDKYGMILNIIQDYY